MQQELTLAIRVTLATLARLKQAIPATRVTLATPARLKQAILATHVTPATLATLALRRSKVSTLF